MFWDFDKKETASEIIAPLTRMIGQLQDLVEANYKREGLIDEEIQSLKDTQADLMNDTRLASSVIQNLEDIIQP